MGVCLQITPTHDALGQVVTFVGAGICEEVLFRGALQPRLGLPATALLFASTHVQYGLSIILGLVVLAVATSLPNTVVAVSLARTGEAAAGKVGNSSARFARDGGGVSRVRHLVDTIGEQNRTSREGRTICSHAKE